MRAVVQRVTSARVTVGERITGQIDAGLLTVVARTNPAPRSKEMSVFLVEPKFKGFRIGTIYDTMGCKGHPIAELLFEDCEVPEENRLGPEGKGWLAATKTLMEGRPVVAARCIGACERLLEISTDYAKTRKQFGQAIGEFQLVQGKLADMYTTMNACKSYVYAVAKACDRGQTTRKDSAGAILYAAEKATQVALDAIQLLGGNGYINDYPTGRLLRDAKLYEIGAGTSEIRRMLIGRELFAETA